MSFLCQTCLQLMLLGLPVDPAQPVSGNNTSGPMYVEPASTQPTARQTAPAARPVAPLIVATPATPAAATTEAAPGSRPVSAPVVATPAGPVANVTQVPVATQDQLEMQHLRMLMDMSQMGRTGPAVLVVPSRQMDAQSMAPLAEDLTIMSRIIGKNLGDGYLLPETSATDSLIINLTLPSQNIGPRLFFPPTRRPKALYVGGYGALFFLQVDFPLVPPAEQAQQAGAGESDPVWSEARRMLYEPPRAGLADNATPTESYSEEKVALLRSRLVEILKHATNIRTLDPNDSVTIVVRSTAAEDGRPPQDTFTGLPSETPCGRTVLTLRARKPDIDLYAQGRLDPAQFEQRVQIASYKQ
jgi:hypothetical protein